MPNWKIHIEVGKRIGKKLKLDENNENLFLLGNIVTDINNGYIVKNISKIISHDYTHFKDGKLPTYIYFYEQYKNQMNENLIILGYFIHLYTDYFWNNDFYTRCNIKDLNHDELRKLKQDDFKKYNDKYINNIIKINDISIAKQMIENIDRVSITEQDIKNVITYIDTQKEIGGEFKFYKTEELDDLLERTVVEIENFLNEKR